MNVAWVADIVVEVLDCTVELDVKFEIEVVEIAAVVESVSVVEITTVVEIAAAVELAAGKPDSVLDAFNKAESELDKLEEVEEVETIEELPIDAEAEYTEGGNPENAFTAAVSIQELLPSTSPTP